MFRRYLALLLLGSLSPLLPGVGPPPRPAAASYRVRIRYQISAFRTERIRQFREMVDVFAKAGFERDPDEMIDADEVENQDSTRMSGFISPRGLDRIVGQRHVRSVLAYAKDAKMPEKGARVRVEMRLPTGHLPEFQRKLHAQTAKVLGGIGFVEGVGYDHRGSSRLAGSVPVEALDQLIADPRKIRGAEDEPAPFRTIGGIRLTVARPDWPLPPGKPAVLEVKDRKIAPDLRARLDDAGPTRLEVILGWNPASGDTSWKRLLSLPGVTIEGRLGPLVTVAGAPKDVAAKLAALDEVAHVRLPRPASVPEGAAKGVASTWKPLEASGVARLHAMGRRGKGTRMAIVGDDFGGWEKLKGRKEKGVTLPDPTLLDLTGERNSTMLPDAPRGGESAATRCALLLQQAAPEAELTLVRIDPAAPYMLEEVARAINGQGVSTIGLDQRLRDISGDRVSLDDRAAALTGERRVVFRQVVDTEEWRQLREAYQKRQDAYDRDEVAFKGRQERYFALVRALSRLKGIRVVASTLVWTEGYPVDGSSALSRYFDDRPYRCALWFQAAGDSNGQAWTGLFRDADDNGVMEFAPANALLPAGSWTHEVNFLGWQAPGSDLANAVLPANARIRVSVQWREAHDALPLRVGEDPYREPLTKLELFVVAQPDPGGMTRPRDDLEVVARSGTFPTRLDQTRNAATYEHVIELTVPRAGRYAVMVEGRLPESIYAKGEGRLPSQRKVGEIRPRLFVRTLEGTGRAVWATFASTQASLGMPADARAVITVAAADENDRIRQASAASAPSGMALMTKPDLLAYDGGGGTAEAASFAAGLVASAWPTTGTVFGVLEGLRVRPGQLLRVPAARGK